MKEIDVIYSKEGIPLLRVFGNGRLVNFNGKSIGFLDNDNVYDYNGNHRGWFIEGILRDHEGNCVGFGEYVGKTLHPFLPFKQFRPFSSFVEFEPFRPFKNFTPLKPFFNIDWSEYDPISMFKI